ncbi:MAG: hypothetical protein CMD96_05980 [Gammaproteobacteria bacterium]|mgnify:CR=1 FL=1|nr:hypothetical protein [Gammaproteobacteria bacterium]|tara:strand:+ start:5639 stop:5920 length:282 start_codon:yes stop_codon:yes gene_type:complete
MDKIFMQYPMIWAMLGGVMGMMAHILKKKVKGETAEAIVDYFTDNMRYTITALIGMVVAVLMVYDPNIVWYKSMLVGAMAGMTCDSAFNKGKK